MTYSANNKVVTDCIEWALAHGYNPYNSTVSLPTRREGLYAAYNAIVEKEHKSEAAKAMQDTYSQSVFNSGDCFGLGE